MVHSVLGEKMEQEKILPPANIYLFQFLISFNQRIRSDIFDCENTLNYTNADIQII